MLFKAEDALIRRDRATIDENTPLLLPNRSKSVSLRPGVTHGLPVTGASTYAAAAARI